MSHPMTWNALPDIYHIVQCSCGTHTDQLDDCLAKETIPKLSPSDALKMTSQYPPNSCFAWEMSNNTDYNPWSRYDSVDLLSLFIKLLEKCRLDSSTSWEGVSWAVPLEGVRKFLDPKRNLLGNLRGQVSKSEAKAIHAIVPLTLDLILKDKDCIKARGLTADTIRLTLTYYISYLLIQDDFNCYTTTDKAIDITWLCWLETPRVPQVAVTGCRNFAIELLDEIMGDKSRLSRYGQRLLTVSSLEYVAYKVDGWLADETLLDDDLEMELRGISVVVQCLSCMDLSPDTRSIPFLDAGVHLKASNAVHRQFCKTGPNDRSILNIVFSAPAIILFPMETRKQPRHGSMAELFSYTPFAKVMSQALILLNNNTTKSKLKDLEGAYTMWEHVLFWIVQQIVAPDEGTWTHSSDESLNVVRQNIELLYLETYSALADERGPLKKKVFDLWMGLCHILGLTPAAMRERFMLLRKCCNLSCPHREVGRSSTKRYCCKDCETVYYCNRTCQKMDWPIHKFSCDPTEFATPERLLSLYDAPRI